MRADEQHDDREWERLATAWRLTEESGRAPDDAVGRAVSAARRRRSARVAIAAAAVVAGAGTLWALTNGGSPSTATYPAYRLSFLDGPDTPIGPCATGESCLDVRARLLQAGAT